MNKQSYITDEQMQQYIEQAHQARSEEVARLFNVAGAAIKNKLIKLGQYVDTRTHRSRSA